MNLRTIAAALAISLAVSLPTYAEDNPESRLKVAEELVAQTVTGSMVDNMTASLWPTVEADIKSKNPNADQAAIDGLKADFIDMQKQQMADLVVDMPAVYAKYFTADELKEILKFQTSEVGRKALAVTPQIMAEFMPKIMQSLQTQMPVIIERFKNKQTEKGYKI